jgi:NAD(P) transhydrogenase subunit alpha
MVESMKPGSIIVDLAVERGGNCELAKANETVTHGGVKIMGQTNMAGRLAGNSSQLYAKNLQNFLELIIGEKGKLSIDWDDEIIAATALTRDGEIVNPVLG